MLNGSNNIKGTHPNNLRVPRFFIRLGFKAGKGDFILDRLF